jgi:hypothetical protein
MKRLWAVGAAALALTISQPDDSSAQRGGARAGGGHSGHGGHSGPSGLRGGAGHRGLAMHGRAIRGGVWRSGLGGRPGWGRPATIGVAAGPWGYYEPNNEQCDFVTHYGRIFTC